LKEQIGTDNLSAIDFLNKFIPEGSWVLTSIDPNKKGIETCTFHSDEPARLESWLEKYNGNRNLYFHVNPTTHDLSKKAERKDIAEVRWLHVDVDPRAGENLAEERKRILFLLQNPPKDVPPPTVIVFSGGGYQAFWHLKIPILIDGDKEKAETAARYNKELERVFEADNCHNIDRIMRLPGSINIPDKGKLKKGRTRILARLLSFREEFSYDLSEFAEPQETSKAAIKLDREIPRTDDLDQLGIKVSDWCKILIAQGRDPDNPAKYVSRSEALFAVVCELVRAGISDSVIYGILSDERYAISSSILEKGKDCRRYILRQLERAKEEAMEPWLRLLNSEHAVVENIGGKCIVISEDEDQSMPGRTRFTVQSFDDFRNRYLHNLVEIGEGKTMPVGKWWLQHRLRRQYRGIAFAPGKELPDYYNLWRGFSCVPASGDCGLYLDHILKNICSDDTLYYDYIVHWLARAVQKPGRQGETAIVLRGRQGTGKSFFAKHFGSLWGRHYMSVADPKFLVGSFNSHLQDCCILFADEAFYAGDKKHEGVLKTLITEDMLVSEAKYRQAELVNNSIHLIMASNSEWIVPAGMDERRFFVLDVGIEKIQNTKYFGAINKQMNSGGREALLFLLQNLDTSEFDVRDIPFTQALQDQKQLSMDPLSEWIMVLASDGILPGQLGSSSIALSVIRDSHNHVADGLYFHARETVPKLRNSSVTALAGVLRKWGCEKWSDGKHRGWKIPPLLKLRETFCRQFGNIRWNHPEVSVWNGGEKPEEEKTLF